MKKLGRCSRCEGFVPAGASACPHCGASSKAFAKLGALGAALGGGAIAFTLMACYGRPPCPEGDRDCYGPHPPKAQDGGPDNPVATEPGAGSTPVAAPPDAGK